MTLVAHGLNVKPEAMLPFINWLTSYGSDVYLIQLSGHYENAGRIQEVTSSIWQEEMLTGYQSAKKAALYHSVPLYFLAYSLGALLGQSMIALSVGSPAFDKQVLIAPAIAIRRRSYLLRLLLFLGNQLSLPSLTPKEFRVNKSLPLHIYQLLFNEEKKVIQTRFVDLNIPTLVFIDPKDELISYRKLIQFKSIFKLTNYQIIALDANAKGRKAKYHHLILSEQTMGKENWAMVTKKIAHFFFWHSE